jgi:two-component system CheB/CheR fusion protein
MLAPDDARHIDSWLAAVARGETIEHLEAPRRRKDGTELAVSVSLSPLRSRTGAVVGAAAIARDVTQLRQAQEAVAAREARIRLLLDSTAEAIYGVDLDGRCTFCNSACARTLGYGSVDEIIGRPVDSVLSHRPAASDEPGEHPARRVLRTGEGTHVADELMVRADGTSFPAEYWSYPIRAEAGLLGAVVTFIDITERKRAEFEIREASRRREQFLAMLSHELRNPLAAVVNATHVLRRSTSERAAVERASDVITRQTEHMARLLDDLLDVARITRGGIELRKADLDFRRVIQLAIEASSPMLQERAVRLTVEMPPEPLPVRGDAARLQQVVGNLLSNAVRYSDVGASIRLSTGPANGDVLCRIRDTGRGIDPGMLEAIFDLFVQGEQDLDRRRGGLGVGLTLVRQIVELHGGAIEAHSDGPGTGSEFRLRLPRQDRALLQPRHDAALAGNGSPPRRVVLAEDQADSREMLRLLLEQLGHVVLEADDGMSALAAIERSHPDVALVDIGLPRMNGYDVARRLRGNPQFDDVLLVALTGYGTAEDVEAARAAGFDEHVTKPSDFDRLTRLITRRREVVQ